MNLRTFFTEAYEAERLSVEQMYEDLMRLEEGQHRERMDAYASQRKDALQRIADKYGQGFGLPAVAEPAA